MFRSIHRRVRRHLDGYRFLADRADLKRVRLDQRKPGDLEWSVGPRGPIGRVEAGSIQLDHELYLFGGYVSLGEVSRRVDVLDLREPQWTRKSTMPENVPQTHAGMAHDGQRYIYSVGGQLGANCSPGVRSCFSFDRQTHHWSELPDLPEIRYMPLVHMHENRLHCFGGTQADRCSPASDHWSLGVSEGVATEKQWTKESPLPESRNHTASKMVGHKLFVLGGQQTDVPAVAGCSEFSCNFKTPADPIFDEVFTFDLKTNQRETRQAMPFPVSHCENTVCQIQNQIVVCGGTRSRQELSDVVLAYDLVNDRWRTIGTLPYPMKSKAAAWHDGRLFVVNGQRSKSATDLRPGAVLDSVWITHLDQDRTFDDA